MMAISNSDRAIFDEFILKPFAIYRQWEYTQINTFVQNLSGQYRSLNPKKRSVLLRFMHVLGLNAYVRHDTDFYYLDVSDSIPILMRTLLERLVSLGFFLGDKDMKGPISQDYNRHFVTDPRNFEQSVDWHLQLSEAQGFAARTIALLATVFAVAHEFGHIVEGHVEGAKYYFGQVDVPELIEIDAPPRRRPALRRAWEYEADKIAVQLLFDWVAIWTKKREDSTMARWLFSDKDGFHLEHTLAMTIACLFCFFCYVRFSAEGLGQRSSHPSPFVRANYIKDLLFTLTLQREASMSDPFNPEVFSERLRVRLSEVIKGLTKLKLLTYDTNSPAFIESAKAEGERLKAYQARHQDSCAEWRWNFG